MAADQEKWISIMIVPEDGTGMRKWRVTSRRYSWYKTAFWFMCLFLLVGFVSMITLGIMYGKLRHYRQFNNQLLEATSKLETIASRLDRYEEKESKLRAILGSDIELPAPVVTETVDSKSLSALGASSGSMNELEQAIANEEARIRKVPTSWPVEAWQITKKFINTGNPRTDHTGVDILTTKKTTVAASAEGKVTFAGVDPDLGQMVVIDHGNGWVTKYGHNESILVKYGSSVRKGEQIAIIGSTGSSSTGPHLHFAMTYKGQPVDPLLYLDKKSILNLADNKN